MPPHGEGKQLELSLTAMDNYLDASKHSRVPNPYKALGGSVGADGSDLLDLLKKSCRLEAYVQELQPGGIALNKRTSPRGDAILAQNVAAAATEFTTAFKAFVVERFEWDPLVTHPTQQSPTKALQVLYVPELAEMILRHLTTKELFSAAQANKAMSTAIASSAKLLSSFDLQPKLVCFWSSNFDPWDTRHYSEDDFPMFCCHIARRCRYDHANRATAPNEVMVTAYFSESKKPVWPLRYHAHQIGSRGRSMLICQPPLLEMEISTRCRSSRCSPIGLGHENMEARSRWSAIAPLKSSTGLTVGDLLEAGAKIEQEHRFCPCVQNGNENPVTGGNKVYVKFSGVLKLRDDDPSLRLEEIYSGNMTDDSGFSTPIPMMDADERAIPTGMRCNT